MERISVIQGDLPVLIIAPHGANDPGTILVAEQIQKEIDAFLVVNRGWMRAKEVDYWRDLADCNKISHCHDEVIKDEFLDPIIRETNRILENWGRCNTYILRSVGNFVRRIAEEPKLDFSVGCGAGPSDETSSYSCDPLMKDAFIGMLNNSGLVAYEGAGTGKYAGRDNNDLNQLFRKWYYDSDVHSMQIEIVKELLEDKDMAKLTGIELASAMFDLIDFDDTFDLFLVPDTI